MLIIIGSHDTNSRWHQHWVQCTKENYEAFFCLLISSYYTGRHFIQSSYFNILIQYVDDRWMFYRFAYFFTSVPFLGLAGGIFILTIQKGEYKERLSFWLIYPCFLPHEYKLVKCFYSLLLLQCLLTIYNRII